MLLRCCRSTRLARAALGPRPQVPQLQLRPCPDGHGFEPKFLQFVGNGFRSGMRPCNQTDIYWFFTWTPSENNKGVDQSAAKVKQFVLASLRSLKAPAEALAVVERGETSDVVAVPLRFRPPLSLMTPDLAQGACAALEDAVILARCLGKAVLDGGAATDQSRRVDEGLREYAEVRRWRSVELIATAYVVGFVQQSDSVVVSFLRDKFLSGLIARRLLRLAEFDCGTLSS